MIPPAHIGTNGRALVALFSLALCACGPAVTPTQEATLESLTVMPVRATLVEGKTQQFTVSYNLSTGIPAATPPAGKPAATWSSSDPQVATIDAMGIATAVEQGSVTIIATSGSFTAYATVVVSATGP